MTAKTAFIDLRNIIKAYDDNVILKGINLSVRRGEFLVLVGPSGCGKSTLLRCIAGLERITSGELHIDGEIANDMHPKDRNLAMVFQSYALYPHLTVEQNLGFSLSVRKMPKPEIKKHVAATAERLGLTPLLARYPKQLSGGQRQRVAVGRAIVRQPNAFLFDEPLSNLDAALRSQMRIELKKLHRDLDATMVYVTHDQIEAMTLADRIVVLEGGVIQQIGTPNELFNTPTNRFVAHFIGSPPMNFFPATFDAALATATGDGFTLRLPDGYRHLPTAPAEVLVGVRPTGLTLDGDGGEVNGTVEAIEPIGGESYVHAKIGDRIAVAQIDATDAQGLQPGNPVTFRVAPSQVYLFDRATEKTIVPAD